MFIILSFYHIILFRLFVFSLYWWFKSSLRSYWKYFIDFHLVSSLIKLKEKNCLIHQFLWSQIILFTVCRWILFYMNTLDFIEAADFLCAPCTFCTPPPTLWSSRLMLVIIFFLCINTVNMWNEFTITVKPPKLDTSQSWTVSP